jgi:uncharacterized membrane-anchored protein YhcB (DUF1043 family)
VNSGMEDWVVVAIVGAAVGLLIGYFFGRRSAPGSEENRELEQKLEDAQAATERFEQRVNAHFVETAGKLNALTENYRDVYAHLASGAGELCTLENGPSFDALIAPSEKGPQTIESDSVMTEPPRDYAPKSSPDEPGVLNENFGLEGEDKPPADSTTRS